MEFAPLTGVPATERGGRLGRLFRCSEIGVPDIPRVQAARSGRAFRPRVQAGAAPKPDGIAIPPLEGRNFLPLALAERPGQQACLK